MTQGPQSGTRRQANKGGALILHVMLDDDIGKESREGIMEVGNIRVLHFLVIIWPAFTAPVS